MVYRVHERGQEMYIWIAREHEYGKLDVARSITGFSSPTLELIRNPTKLQKREAKENTYGE